MYLFTSLDGVWVELAAIHDRTEYFGDVIDLSGNNIVITSDNNAYVYSVEGCLDLI